MDKFLKIHLPKSDLEIKDIWEKAIIVVDTNVLLNLYKYTSSTRDEFYKIFEHVNSKAWIPHQVAFEFLMNRQSKILEEAESFNSQIKVIQDAKKAAIEQINKKVSSISKSFRKVDSSWLSKEIEAFFESKIDEIKEKNSDFIEISKTDLILAKFLDMYNNKIGEPFNQDELNEIYIEGEARYKKSVPPGYKDYKEKKGQQRSYKDTVIKNKYGDLILWKQIIKKAERDNSPVIFITDEKKEDWWRIIQNQLKGARGELINEFFNETNNEFLLYRTESFLENSKKFLNLDVQISAIKEVHEYSRMNNDIKRSNSKKMKSIINERNKLDYLLHEINQELNEFSKEVSLLEVEYGELAGTTDISALESVDRKLNYFISKIDELTREKEMIMYQIHENNIDYHNMK